MVDGILVWGRLFLTFCKKLTIFIIIKFEVKSAIGQGRNWDNSPSGGLAMIRLGWAFSGGHRVLDPAQ
jgi:hypothetical protein